MFKVLKIGVLVVASFLLLFLFLPSGSSASDVLAGYTSTLSYTSSGTLPYQFINVTDAEDPYLEDVEAAAEAAGGHVDYLWSKEDGTPVSPHRKTSTFPRRGGDLSAWADNVGGSGTYHMGTDLVPASGIQKQEPIYQVAVWGGTVVKVGDNPGGWGYYVVLDHGNNFYTRYAHMGNGNSASNTGSAPGWQHGSQSSVLVKVGDAVTPGTKLGYIGTTGNSTGMHAHIELILCPQGFNDGANRHLKYYYGGIDNIIRGEKTLSEITWYQIIGDKSAISDMAEWGDLSKQEVSE